MIDPHYTWVADIGRLDAIHFWRDKQAWPAQAASIPLAPPYSKEEVTDRLLQKGVHTDHIDKAYQIWFESFMKERE